MAGKAGRPSKYTAELAERICARIIACESLRAICTDDDMPDAATVFRWLASTSDDYVGFREQYARARTMQAEHLVDQILEISDDGRNDWMERQSEAEKGGGIGTGWVLNGEHVQRSRLRVDSRKWFASKVAPKIYGDKIAAEVSGANGGPLVVSWAMSPEQGTSDPSGK